MVPVAAGKHRRPDDEPPQVPAPTPLSTAAFFRPPPDAAGPVDAWGPTRYGTPGPQAAAAVGLPRLPVRRPASGPYPGDAAPRGTMRAPDDHPAPGYGPGRDNDPGHAPPSDRPEYGQRWLYAVRNDAPAAGPAGPRPGRPPTAPSADPQVAWARPGRPPVPSADPQLAGPFGPGADLQDGGAGHVSGGQPMTADDQAAAIKDEAWDEAAAIRRAAQQEAASIRQQAERRAAAIRQVAEREAADLRSALLAMYGELDRAAAYLTQSLATPGAAPTVPPAVPPAAIPGGSTTGPAWGQRPAARS